MDLLCFRILDHWSENLVLWHLEVYNHTPFFVQSLIKGTSLFRFSSL